MGEDGRLQVLDFLSERFSSSSACGSSSLLITRSLAQPRGAGGRGGSCGPSRCAVRRRTLVGKVGARPCSSLARAGGVRGGGSCSARPCGSLARAEVPDIVRWIGRLNL